MCHVTGLRPGFLALSCLLALLPAQAGAAATDEGPDLILHQGRVFAATDGDTLAQALAVRGDKVIAVGSNLDVLALGTGRTRRVDLRGRTVIPGINDAHDHLDLLPFGTDVSSKSPNPPLELVLAGLRQAAETASPGSWLYATVGPAIILGPEDARKKLDAVAPAHPVLLHGYWGHGFILNSRGLERSGLGEDAVDPAGGRLDRTPDGRLSGRLEEYAGWAVLRRLQSALPTAVAAAELRRYAQDRLRAGVTSVQLMPTYWEPGFLLRTLQAADVPLRIHVFKWPYPGSPDFGLAEWRDLEVQPMPRVIISGLKYVLDGTPIEQLAFRSQPYPNRGDWRGRMNFLPDELRRILAGALEGGEPLALHIVGDVTARAILTAMEGLAGADRWRERRVRFEHGNGLTGELLDRARRLGVIVAQPRPTAPLQAWLAAGIPVAYGSDMARNPFEFIVQATGAGPGKQPISRPDAVRIMTRGPAFAEFQESAKGTLAAGQLADLVVLSDDLFAVEPEKLARIHSLLTMVGGKIVFKSEADW